MFPRMIDGGRSGGRIFTREQGRWLPSLVAAGALLLTGGLGCEKSEEPAGGAAGAPPGAAQEAPVGTPGAKPRGNGGAAEVSDDELRAFVRASTRMREIQRSAQQRMGQAAQSDDPQAMEDVRTDVQEALEGILADNDLTRERFEEIQTRLQTDTELARRAHGLAQEMSGENPSGPGQRGPGPTGPGGPGGQPGMPSQP